MVFTEGQYKGLKAKVIFADDNLAKIEILSNQKKLEVPRRMIMEIRDPTQPMMAREL